MILQYMYMKKREKRTVIRCGQYHVQINSFIDIFQ